MKKNLKFSVILITIIVFNIIIINAQTQSDASDSVFAIVAPRANSKDIDMKQCLVGDVKDSIIKIFLSNSGTYPVRIDTIYFKGNDAAQFKLLNNYFPFSIAPGAAKTGEFLFFPSSTGIKTSQIKIVTQSDTLTQNIQGEGLQPSISVLSKYIDFGVIGVGDIKDSIAAMTIANTSGTTIDILSTKHDKPNDYDFSTLASVFPTTLQAGDTLKMNLRFSPSSIGRTSGMLNIYYNGPGSPARIQLFGQGLGDCVKTFLTK